MPPKPRAAWSVDPKTVKASTDSSGTFILQATLLDGGVKVLTCTLSIDADRVAKLLIHGESAASSLADFFAWSDF